MDLEYYHSILDLKADYASFAPALQVRHLITSYRKLKVYGVGIFVQLHTVRVTFRGGGEGRLIPV